MTTTGSADVSALQNAMNNRVMIERAKGYVAQQYDISIDDAFDLLRTYCRRSSLPLGDVASKVVAGTELPTYAPTDFVRGASQGMGAGNG